MPKIKLEGCAPEPMVSYLKAVGVLRIVAQQKDPLVRTSWKGGTFSLDSLLDCAELVTFFLREYRPTPILAPWNGGSGFYPRDRQEAIKAIEGSSSPRFEDYKVAIRTGRNLLQRLGVRQKPGKGKDKAAILLACRAELSDDVIPWLDAAYVLFIEGPEFPPLLGTGGNDGRLEFTNNFMQRLVQVIPLEGGSSISARSEPAKQGKTGKSQGSSTSGLDERTSEAWLRATLYGAEGPPLIPAAIGQFHPGGVGGPNATQGFEAESLVNPWDYILMLEGALLFAGSAARRYGLEGRGGAASPFTVRTSRAGYGSASAKDETVEGSRAEIWMPLWEKPATLLELTHLLAEGRAQVGRRQARTGVDFARAVAGLGVDRGIAAFQRYGLLKRSGKAYLAAPLGRIPVDGSRAGVADLLLEVDPWLDRFRRRASAEDAPAACASALRNLDRAIFRASLQADPRHLQDVLIALGEAEAALARSPKFRDDHRLRPLEHLSPRWLRMSDDLSPEFRLAAALASIRGDPDGKVGPIRCYLEPVTTEWRRVVWTTMDHSVAWSGRDPESDLIAILERRMMDARREGLQWLPLRGLIHAELANIHEFLQDRLDVSRLVRLAFGLGTLRWDAYRGADHGLRGLDQPPPEDLSRPYAFLKLLHLPGAIEFTGGRLHLVIHGSSGGVIIRPDFNVVRLLRAGRTAEACERVAMRLRASGLIPLGARRGGAAIPWDMPRATDSRRIAAALIFPVTNLAALADAVLRPPAEGAQFARKEGGA